MRRNFTFQCVYQIILATKKEPFRRCPLSMVAKIVFLVALFELVLAVRPPLSKNYEKVSENTYCYTEDDNPYYLFSTKTPYEFLHGNLSEVKVPESKYFISIIILLEKY